YAAAALDEHEPDALRTASIAKAYAGRATLDVAHGALQVFGGIAFTAEHPAHRFLRRVVARREEFGTPRDHARRLRRALARGLEVVASDDAQTTPDLLLTSCHLRLSRH